MKSLYNPSPYFTIFLIICFVLVMVTLFWPEDYS